MGTQRSFLKQLVVGGVNHAAEVEERNATVYLIRQDLYTCSVVEGVHTLPSLLFDHSLLHFCFMQTNRMNKADKMRRMRITMATATTTPMMTAVSIPTVPGGGGGERDTH